MTARTFYRKDNLFARCTGRSPVFSLFPPAPNGFLLGGTGGYWADQDGKNFVDQYLVSGDLNWQINKYNFIKAGFIAKQHWINVFGRGVRASREWTNNNFAQETLLFSLKRTVSNSRCRWSRLFIRIQ